MQDVLAALVELLKTDERLVSEGKLLKNKVVELALSLDPKLLKILLKQKPIRSHFFADVDGVVVFDKIKFQKFVSNKQFLPDSYTAFKNKIGLTADEDFLTESREVVLAWPYKDCVLEGGQTKEEAKREEIFWNETLAPEQIDRLLAPKVLTRFERYDKKGKQKVEALSLKDSWIIKGNNLLTLHTLKKVYAGKVKLIYIDPPYNPDSKANTLCYNNSFNRSTFLTFMQNRLAVAKDLMRKDGVMIVAIDEREQARLAILLEEMFPHHEVHCITIVHNPRGVQGTNFSYTHEYAFFVIPADGDKHIANRKIAAEDVDWAPLRNWGTESERKDAKNCFYPVIVKDEKVIGFGDVLDDKEHPKQTEKKKDLYYIYPIDRKGIERKWRYARQTVEEIKHLLRVVKTASGFDIELGKDFETQRTVWSDPRYDANKYGTQLVKSLVPGCKFDFPKSLWNVYDCLEAVIGSDKEAIVLDFFGGSGTTAHAVLELNRADKGQRRFIICEQMHYIETVTRERVKKVLEMNGSGEFVYAELAEANERFVGAVKAAKKPQELREIWKEMQRGGFLSFRVDPAAIDSAKKDFEALDFKQQQSFLIEVLDKNMLYVPLCEIEDEDHGISKTDKVLNEKFFSLR